MNRSYRPFTVLHKRKKIWRTILMTNHPKNPRKTTIQRSFLGTFLALAAFVRPTMFVFFQKSSYKVQSTEIDKE